MGGRPGARRWPLLLACVFSALFILACLPKLGSPGLNHDEALQGAEAVLFLRRLGAGARLVPENIGSLSSAHWFLHRFPWMTLPYLGALKTYILALVFWLFGTGVLTLRATTVLLGAAAVFSTVCLVSRRYGPVWAAAAGLWLATDPALVFMARYDNGPAVLGVALKMGGIALVDLGLSTGSSAPLLLGGILFGLALWDKAHFLWFLFGAASAALLWTRSRHWRAAFWIGAGFLLGALPWIGYNAAVPLQSFRSQPALSGIGMAAYFSDLAAVVPVRWRYLAQTLSAQGAFGFLTQTAPQRPCAGLLLAAGGLMTLAALWVWLARGAKSRDPAFWLTVAAGAFLACCLTPMRVYLYHMPMLYPFPHLALLALLAAAFPAGPRSAAAVLCAAFFAAAAASNSIVLARAYAALDGGGSSDWYAGGRDLSDYCVASGGPVVSLSVWFTAPVTVYSGGRVLPEERYGDMDTETAYRRSWARLPAYLKAPGTLLLVCAAPGQNLLPRRFLRRLADGPDARVALVHAVAYSDGAPWAEVYRVNARGRG